MDDYKTGHRERLRARAEDTGMDAMRSHEILELILCYAVPRVDMNETARILIKRFGSLKNVFSASAEELMEVPGVGKSVVDWLSITGELVNAYCAIDPADQQKVMKYKDAIEYAVSLHRDIDPPKSVLVFTDFNKRILMKSVICDSLSWAHSDYIRRIINEALSLQAKHAFLILYSGTTEFEIEEGDIKDLLNLSRSLQAIDVELIDCILYSESDIKSLNACGIMNTIKEESRNKVLFEEYISE